MFNIIKSVIDSTHYELTDILKKIDTQWIKGAITTAEKETLVSLARNSANPNNSIDIYAKLAELEARIKALEERKDEVPDDDSTTTPEEPAVADFVVGKTYYNGDKVKFDGKTYTCIAPAGAVCVWSPADYPAYWELTE